ncbi:hypothetical protein O181_013391 [Austropuccinia psidii MF-1]|uniref:Uncharacterized protein n=1 Tax=Austropuccinia psidii MF-1 TaxID=1389203 RepID=A0A9Q3BZM1_9BASI|nr:hypothetical protein [Austropuccinia psidii MF-1]
MGLSSSSREKIVDDDEENMSPTQRERNGEQRSNKLTADEEGTWENSKFTHPQMPITQSMFDQSKIRQQRNYDCKDHNVAKRASQKEQQRWLKEELPDNVHGMSSAVHAHFLFLLKVKDNNLSSQPAPPSTEHYQISIKVAGPLGYVPKDFFNEK